MAVPFLSEDWCEAVKGAAAGVSLPGGLEARVHIRIDGPDPAPTWTLAVAGGRIEESSLDAGGHADLEAWLTMLDAWAILSGQVDGTEAMRRLRVGVPGGRGRAEVPSPLDLGGRSELNDLVAIPGADLDVQYHYSEGPFGAVDFGLSFRDGWVATAVLGEIDDPDVQVWCTFLQMAQVRRGDIGILDVLAAGGRVDGPEGALALLAGISESPEFRAAEVACGPSGPVLGILGQYHDSCLAPALRAVMAETDAPPEAG